MQEGVIICESFEKFETNDRYDLIVSSPPYGIGKTYENTSTIDQYRTWATGLVKRLAMLVSDHGAVVWNVGTHTQGDGEYFPLDVLYIPLFCAEGFVLKNRIIWHFNHGLHDKKRLSGRYEVVLWFVRDAKNFTFNLDLVRVPSKYPNKKAYKGKNKGKLSGNPLGSNPSDVWKIMVDEWEQQMWDFPNVKSNHVEKMKEHPCQFPVELAERAILAFSNENDKVLDPFCGVGTVGIAAVFHRRKFVGIDKEESFCQLAKERIHHAAEGTLKTRQIGTPIYEPSAKEASIPEEWKEIIDTESKKPRIYRMTK